MNILQKIQNQPEKNRKFILWAAVVIIGLVLLFFQAKNFQKNFQDFKIKEFKDKLNLPKLEIPKIEMPELEERKEEIKEDIEELEKAAEEAEKEQVQ